MIAMSYSLNVLNTIELTLNWTEYCSSNIGVIGLFSNIQILTILVLVQKLLIVLINFLLAEKIIE